MSAPASDPAQGSDPRPLIEAHDDSHETHMSYDPSGRLPRLVLAIWLIALSSFGVYFVRYLLSDLGKWGRP